MNFRHLAPGLAGALTLASASAALADDAPVTTDRMTLPAGGLLITADLEVSLSKDAVGKPISLAPDIWYGVQDKLTVGLVHSTRGAFGLLGAAGDGVCLTGKSNGCAKVYDGVGADVRYQVHETAGDGLGVALDGGILATSFDPFALGLKVGAIAHLRHGKLAVDVAPGLYLGLTKRDGNPDVLALPISLHVAAAPKVGVALQTGLLTPLDGAGDGFMVPLSLGASFAVTPKAFVGLTFSLPALLGGDAVADGVDQRTLTIGGGYAL